MIVGRIVALDSTPPDVPGPHRTCANGRHLWVHRLDERPALGAKCLCGAREYDGPEFLPEGLRP